MMAMVSGIRRVGDLLNYLIESQQTFLTFLVFFIELFCDCVIVLIGGGDNPTVFSYIYSGFLCKYSGINS